MFITGTNVVEHFPLPHLAATRSFIYFIRVELAAVGGCRVGILTPPPFTPTYIGRGTTE